MISRPVSLNGQLNSPSLIFSISCLRTSSELKTYYSLEVKFSALNLFMQMSLFNLTMSNISRWSIFRQSFRSWFSVVMRSNTSSLDFDTITFKSLSPDILLNFTSFDAKILADVWRPLGWEFSLPYAPPAPGFSKSLALSYS